MAFDDTNALISQGLEENLFTGAVLLISLGKDVVFHRPYGTLGGPGTHSVTETTVFDLASLTKVLATTPCWILMASDEPDILDESLLKWFPDLPQDKWEITPRQLLAHASGLPAWRPYYLMGVMDPVDPGRLSHAILREQLVYPPGTGCLYSDLGFMLLGFILEKQLGHDIVVLSKKRVYEPLGLENDLMFRPEPRRYKLALTREGDQPGAVNDLNARALGRAAGHAGLFGTAQGVATLCTEILTGLKSEESYFPAECVRTFCRRTGITEDTTRALGFDMPTSEGSSSGRFFSSESLGHTGFTGTSVWMDPVTDLCVVLLTNRVIMGEADQRIKLFRPALHDTIVQECIISRG